jgi:hypothetical protein
VLHLLLLLPQVRVPLLLLVPLPQHGRGSVHGFYCGCVLLLFQPYAHGNDLLSVASLLIHEKQTVTSHS